MAVINGTNGNNVINGTYGNDTINAKRGNDRIYDYGGNETYLFNLGDGQDSILDYKGNDRILFGAGITKNSLKFSKKDRNLVININGTTDQITVLDWFKRPDYVIERLEFSDGSFLTSQDVEKLVNTPVTNIINGTPGDDNLQGTPADEIIYGFAGNDMLSGNGGIDSLIGGTGNDNYIYEVGDIITENPNEGIDTVNTGVSYTLGANLDNLVLTGNSNINGTGNTLNNIITGNSGSNILNGGTGNDAYVFNVNWGQDAVFDNSGVDSFLFGDGILKDNIEFSKNNNDLLISDITSFDTININNWFGGNNNKIESLVFQNGSITAQEIDNLFVQPGEVITGTSGNDNLVGTQGNDSIYGLAGNDTINGNQGADLMVGGEGNDIYYVDDINDVITENSKEASPPDASWIESSMVRDIYTRTYPHVMGNQWHIANDGMISIAAVYKTVNGNSVIDWNASWQRNNQLLQLAVDNFDYIVLNRDARRSGVSGEYTDVFLDNYDSIKNSDTGLGVVLKWLNQMNLGDENHLYVLPYLNMTDVFTLQSVTVNPDWDFWHSQEKFGGQNFGSWDYANNNNLFVVKNGEILHCYYSSSDDGKRYALNSTNPLWQQYYIDHAVGIVNAGFDGVFSDNWARTKFGDLTKLTNQEFTALQQGWNAIGAGIKDVTDGKILVGNSPPYALFTSRDTLMLEDRIDDVLGTNDKSVASYFRYSYYSKQYGQVAQDTYREEGRGPFETFRLPINLLTDNVLGLGANTDKGTLIDNYIQPLVRIGEIGNPLGDREIVPGTDTGIKDSFSDYSVSRAVYRRYFSNGVVFLNDTSTQQTVNLPAGTWMRSDGVTFAGGDNITLESLRGWVFKKTDGSPLTLSEGNDTVYSSVSHTLAENVENLYLTGANSLTGAGNKLDNKIYANSAGGSLFGMDGNDSIYGNSGNDTLVGGTGNDSLIGAAGNDTYEFNLGEDIDTITDSGGNDLIKLGNQVNKQKVAFFSDPTGKFYLDYGTNAGMDKVVVNNWNNSANQIEKVQLDDGSFLSNTEINQIIQNMTAYAVTNGIACNTVEDVRNNSELMSLYMTPSWHA